MNATINTMTVAQLKEQLTAKNIKFAPKMKREALVELLEQNQEEAMTETREFPEAKAVKPIADPMEQAAVVIQEIIANWKELDTLTRSELLCEVSLSMGDDFVQENRKKLVGIAVEMIAQEMEKRTNNPTQVEPVDPVEPVEPVAKPKKTKKAKVQAEEKTEQAEGVEPVEPVANPKKTNVQAEEKTEQAEGVEPVEPVAKPKKTKKTKVQAEEPEVVKPNLEEMTLHQIREHMSANGMEKQLGKLNAILNNMEKTKKKVTKPRQPSMFNLFMKEEMAMLKEQCPEMNHREMFSTASSNWKTSEKNPKNIVQNE